MSSWWDHEKEVAEHSYFREWNPELWKKLQHGDVEVGNYVYHLTLSSVERWPKQARISRSKRSKVYYERAHRKNYNILGKKLTRERLKKTTCTAKAPTSV